LSIRNIGLRKKTVTIDRKVCVVFMGARVVQRWVIAKDRERSQLEVRFLGHAQSLPLVLAS